MAWGGGEVTLPALMLAFHVSAPSCHSCSASDPAPGEAVEDGLSTQTGEPSGVPDCMQPSGQ